MPPVRERGERRSEGWNRLGRGDEQLRQCRRGYRHGAPSVRRMGRPSHRKRDGRQDGHADHAADGAAAIEPRAGIGCARVIGRGVSGVCGKVGIDVVMSLLPMCTAVRLLGRGSVLCSEYTRLSGRVHCHRIGDEGRHQEQLQELSKAGRQSGIVYHLSDFPVTIKFDAAENRPRQGNAP